MSKNLALEVKNLYRICSAYRCIERKMRSFGSYVMSGIATKMLFRRMSTRLSEIVSGTVGNGSSMFKNS